MTLAGPMFFVKTRLVSGGLAHRLYRSSFILSPDRLNRFTAANTEICIEGFPRSANSFAFNLFSVANPQICNYARHIHTVSQVAEAVSKNIPTLLLVREPRKTVTSFMSRFPQGDLTWVAKSYVAYYRMVLPFAKAVVVSDFPQTTGNLSFAVLALNERYGTSFQSPTEEHISQARQNLLVFSERGLGVGGLPPIRQKSRESAPQLRFPAPLLAKAEEAFEAVRRHSVC